MKDANTQSIGDWYGKKLVITGDVEYIGPDILDPVRLAETLIFQIRMDKDKNL